MSKKKREKKCPVETGGDFRAAVRSDAKERRGRDKEVSAPDGVSGRWGSGAE